MLDCHDFLHADRPQEFQIGTTTNWVWSRMFSYAHLITLLIVLMQDAKSVENRIFLRYSIFDIWDVREMFEKVACFILIHVTALKHIRVDSLCNNKNQVPIIRSFYNHFSDFEKNIFWHNYSILVLLNSMESYQTFYSYFS